MKTISTLILLLSLALTIFYSGCATQTAHVDNRDHAPAVAYNFEETSSSLLLKETGFPFYGLIVEAEKINNKPISQEELNSNNYVTSTKYQ